MIIQHVLLIIEWDYYLDVFSDIQGYRFNFYKNEKNELILNRTILMSLGYVGFLIIFMNKFIVEDKASILNGFIYVLALYATWDFCLLFYFDKGIYHWPVLLFDIFVVGGVCIALTQYLLNNFYTILKNYTPLLFVLYLITMIMFFYKCYTYNPDLSNIKRVVWA
jgi:hypothetical protein